MAARDLPSAAVQRARQAKLPDEATLQAALDAALADSTFRADVFGEFIEDVATARTLPPMAPADLAGTPLAAENGREHVRNPVPIEQIDCSHLVEKQKSK